MNLLNRPISLITLLLTVGFFALACQNPPHNPENNDFPPVIRASLPATPDGFTPLSLSTGLDHSTFLWDESGTEGYFYAEIKAKPFIGRKMTRLPLNLSIVIDKSGSMHGLKLDNAKRAAKYVIDQLESKDYVSIVEYDGSVNVVSTSNITGDKELLYRKIDKITAGGSTNLGGGMQEGYKQVKSTFKAGAVNRVLLLSDGLANEGITDMQALQRIAKAKNLEEGITLSTFGVGLDYNETLMTNLSEFGSGNYYFIPNPEGIAAIFQEELNGLLNVVAKNATLNIHLPDGISVSKVFGYPSVQTGNQLIIQFRDIVSLETKAVLLKFKVNGNAPEYAFHTQLTYQDPTLSSQEFSTMYKDDLLTRTQNLEEFGKSITPAVKSQAILFESNEKLEEAMREVDAGNYDHARKITQENELFLQSNDAYVRGNAELERQMSNNSSYQNQIFQVETMKDADRNYLQKATRSTNYDVRKKR